jgi:hypothetical protein
MRLKGVGMKLPSESTLMNGQRPVAFELNGGHFSDSCDWIAMDKHILNFDCP